MAEGAHWSLAEGLHRFSLGVILFCVDSIVPAAPTGRNSGPRLGLPSSEALDHMQVVTGPQCQPCEKEATLHLIQSVSRSHSRCRNMLSSGRGAGKWHFNTNSLSCQPHPQGFLQAERNTRRLVFSTPSLPRCQERLFWGTAQEKPYSPRSSSPAKKPWPAGADRTSGCQEVFSPFTLVEKPPPLCQVPTLAAPSMAPDFHEQHLFA